MAHEHTPSPHRAPRAIVGSCLAFILALLAAGCAPETGYPNRPIVLICPWGAGGGTDTVAREIAMRLERELAVPVNVINATGGGGVTGHTRGALARPDGYTLTIVTVELNMLHWRGLTSVSHEDYRPLGLLNKDASALFVRTDAPWKTPGDLADHIRTAPRKLAASGTAHGGIWHLGLAGWLKTIGLNPGDVTWISINGAADSLQELMAGGVELVACSLPEARNLMLSGNVRCLGVMAAQRLEEFPDVPTFQEQGIDWVMGGWRGIAVPAATPEPIAARLEAALAKVINGAEFRGFMRNAGFNWTYEDSDGFRATLEHLDTQFGELLTGPDFRVMGQQHVGRMFFPGLLAGIGAVVFLILLVTGGLRQGEAVSPISRLGWLRAAEVVAWIAAYILFAEWAGFVITAALLLALLMVRLGVRVPAAAVISLALVPALYHIFAVMLRVPLPRGWLGW